MKTRLLHYFISAIILTLTGIFFVSLINNRVQSYSNGKIADVITRIPEEKPPPVAIVFGAGVWNNSEPSPVLYDRIVTAVELYRAHRVQKLLMSGDNRFENYDEPTVMKETAVKLGIPAEDIVLDYAGRRTYDTCWRAKEIFEVRKAVLVTQEFHQARALYLCNNLGIESVGIMADRRQYEGTKYWEFREIFSRLSAWFEINIYSLQPVGGKKESIN